jgi:hypothetical protein
MLVERPISAFFMALCVFVVAFQLYVWLRKRMRQRGQPTPQSIAS